MKAVLRSLALFQGELRARTRGFTDAADSGFNAG